MKHCLFLVILLLATSSYGADNAASVCFPEADAARLLQVLEKDLPDCQAGKDAADKVIEAQESHLEELQGERDQCVEASKQAAKASEDAVDAAKGSWWERLRKALGTMGGAAGGAAIGATFGGPGGAALGGAVGALLGRWAL